MEATARWTDGMRFDLRTGSGHTLEADADAETGGRDAGPRPKELLLAALASCTAMDVASVLRKMRQPFRGLRVRAGGEPTAEHPRVFRRIDLVYEVEGEGCDAERVAHAVELSRDRYCGVNAMLRPAVEVRARILLNGVPVAVPETAGG